MILDVMGLDIVAPARLTRESGEVQEGQSGRLLYAELLETRGFRAGDFVTVRLQEPPLGDGGNPARDRARCAGPGACPRGGKPVGAGAGHAAAAAGR